jgi:hypothetical protein
MSVSHLWSGGLWLYVIAVRTCVVLHLRDLLMAAFAELKSYPPIVWFMVVPTSASSSARSFPSMPQWLGTHVSVNCLPGRHVIERRIDVRMLFFPAIFGCCRHWSEDMLSVTSLALDQRCALLTSHLKAASNATISVWKDEQWAPAA